MTKSANGHTTHFDSAASSVPADLFRAGMRQLASGVALITSVAEGTPVGLVATAVNSVSADPPSVLICVNRNASAHDGILRSGSFCLNILSTDDLDLVEVFSSSSRRAERFAGGSWMVSKSGSPILESASSSFDCRIVHHIEHGTHSVFLAEVLDVRFSDQPADPLIYLDRRFRTLEPSNA